jgi:hypothetical protein
MPEPTFSPDDALRVVEAAGLDPGRPLSEQLGATDQGDDVAAQLAKLSERVDHLTETLGSQGGRAPANVEEIFASRLAERLAAAQSRWLSFGEATNDAA